MNIKMFGSLNTRFLFTLAASVILILEQLLFGFGLHIVVMCLLLIITAYIYNCWLLNHPDLYTLNIIDRVYGTYFGWGYKKQKYGTYQTDAYLASVSNISFNMMYNPILLVRVVHRDWNYNYDKWCAIEETRRKTCSVCSGTKNMNCTICPKIKKDSRDKLRKIDGPDLSWDEQVKDLAIAYASYTVNWSTMLFFTPFDPNDYFVGECVNYVTAFIERAKIIN